jgi:phosphate transport system substrate-binding protein
MRKLSFLLFSTIILSSLMLSACGSAATPASTTGSLSGNVSVSGAFALYPMMTVWADEFTKVNPGVTFDVQGGGAGKGMTDTLSGAVDIGMISRAIKPEEEKQGAFWVAVAKDAVFPVVSANNPVAAELTSKGISQDTFNKIFITGEITTWGEVVGKPEDKDAIHVYTRSDSAGAADTWALFCGGKVQADILSTAVGVYGEPALVDTVVKDPLGIGFSNLNSVFDITSGKLVAGTLVPPIDANKNGKADADEYFQSKADAVSAVASGKYPSPPARFEYLATKGKPTGLTLAFINWILTDGQKFLDAAGYVPLTPDQQNESLTKLK